MRSESIVFCPRAPVHFWLACVDGRLRGHDVAGARVSPTSNVMPARACTHASFDTCDDGVERRRP
jgi:hypothetical protein